MAKLFNSGKLAGCVVSDRLLETIERYAAGPDKGKRFCQELAAKQLAVFKGLGFAAGYLGGIHKADGFGADHRPGRELQARRLARFRTRDPVLAARRVLPLRARIAYRTGRPGGRINREYLDTLEAPAEVEGSDAGLPAVAARSTAGRSRATRRLYPLLKRIYARWDKKPGFLSRMAYRLERASKLAMYGCRDCGDCSLPDCAYLVPQEILLEVRPQRALRRLGRRPLRIGRQRVFLGAGLRAAEVLRRVGRRCSSGR